MVTDVHTMSAPSLPIRSESGGGNPSEDRVKDAEMSAPLLPIRREGGGRTPSEDRVKGVYGTIATVIVVLYVGYSTGIIGSLDIALWTGIPFTPVLLGLIGAGTLFAFLGFLHVFLPRAPWSILSFILCTLAVICFSVALLCIYWTSAARYGLLGYCLVWMAGVLVMVICVGLFARLLCEKDRLALTYLMGTK